MKKAEIIIGAMALIAIVLNLFLVPTSDILLVVLLSALAVLYGYLSFALFNNIRLRHIFKKKAYTGISKLRIVGAVLLGMALATTILGILFRLMSFPGAMVNLYVGILGIAIALVVGLSRYYKSKSIYYTRVFKRIAVIGGIGLMLLLLPKNTWLEFKYRNHPAYLEALNEAQAHPENQELWDKVAEEREKMN